MHNPSIVSWSGVILAACLLPSPALAVGGPSDAEASGSPLFGWSAGVKWGLEVVATEKKQPAPYTLNVVVHRRTEVAGQDCWRVLFAIGRGAPSTLGPNRIVFVSTASGWPVLVQHNAAGLPVQPLGGLGAHLSLPRRQRGFPWKFSRCETSATRAQRATPRSRYPARTAAMAPLSGKPFIARPARAKSASGNAGPRVKAGGATTRGLSAGARS